MRGVLVAAALALAACSTLTPRDIANNRRDLVAKQVGCAPIDVKVLVVPEDKYGEPWIASCGDKNYVCTGEGHSWPPQFVVNCEYR